MSIDRVLSQLLASGAASGIAGGRASRLLTSKAGRKLGGKVLRVGGIAAVGGLAHAAWSRYREGTGDAATRSDTALERFVPAADRPQEAEALGIVLLRAMIVAAHADGRLDGRERYAIWEHVASLDLPGSEREQLLACIEQPFAMETLVAAATTPEIAAQIYTAVLLAIDVDTLVERAWLVMLAARLGLPEDLVGEIHRELGVPDPDALSQAVLQPATS